ncbi:putative gustatory receptor 98a [Drosophila nasuta]|uniref:putative gustatory receptor 98a n=1 Tax=Drosophila nasuta TaxID=42062 RepID=UPI00295EE897|nr:putative gustatory receptor 98a [Drosophila nasuta]
MWHVPIELHNVSLRLMRRLMHLLLLLPPQVWRHVNLFYMVALFAYLAFFFHWRISFNYQVVYDIQVDFFSRFIDVLNFLALITCHIAVAMELLWRNRSEQIEQQLERMRYMLRVQFGHQVNLQRIQSHCRCIYGSLLLRCIILLGMSIYNNLVTDESLLLYYNFYSEIVLLIRFSEFSLYSVLIMAFYQELIEVSSELVEQLQSSGCELTNSLERLSTLRQLHSILWNTIRSIERNFERSLIIVMLKLFVDIFVLPYWIFINVQSQRNAAIVQYCAVEELVKFLELSIPFMIWSRCELLQRKFRSILHSLSAHRVDGQLNACLWRLSAQLGQESCQFSAGGFLVINNEMLGKFIFGMASYIVICIQFRMSMLDKSPAALNETQTVTVAIDA